MVSETVPGARSLSVGVWVGHGSRDEPAERAGLCHLLEHLMFKGTKNIAVGEFSKTVARNGGRDNAFTYLDWTAYFETMPASDDNLEFGISSGVAEVSANKLSILADSLT